jgi:hypothetical protein
MGTVFRPRLIAAATAVALALPVTTFATPGPGAGQSFGDDDGGCVPLRSALRQCSDSAASAYSKLESAIDKCHALQAAAAFSTFSGSPKTFDEDGCEADAMSAYGDKLTGLESSGNCGASALLTTAPDAAANLLTSLDSRGTTLYCDASSATQVDPGGNDSGFVPASHDALTCTRRVGVALAKLAKSVLRCHEQMAASGLALADPPFDEEACEQAATSRYASSASKLLVRGSCAACLDAAAMKALCDDTVSRLDTDNALLYPCPDPVLHPGAVLLDRPTLMALGVQLPISGDENRNASVTLRYRQVGSPDWIDGMPLLRVEPETVAPDDGVIAEQFAGSILDLRPATEYEIELHAVDPDGPVDQTLTINGTTRAVPADPASPNPVAVSDAASLSNALAAAQPGDVITLADGVYTGAFVIDASGTAANPIVIRGTSRDGTILDGNASDGNVFEAYGSYVHVENLTLRNANRALRFQAAGAIGDVVRRVHTTNTRLGIATREGQYDFYICDNLMQGLLSWPQIYTDDGGIHANDDGINVQGFGHVVCHNDMVGFGDAMKTELVGARAVDFYGNEIRSAYDNGVELDESEGNVRAWRNRFTDTFATISFQPIFGGPAYAIRNIVVNIAGEQMKFHGNGAANGPSGVLAYNNTFLSSQIELQVSTDATSHNFEVRNNLFIGPSTLPGRAVDWTAPIVGGLFDSDGWYPDGAFRFDVPPAGLVAWPSFADMQAGGIFEASGTLLAQPIFASGLMPPPSYTTALAPQDVTLDASSNAIDAGAVIPGVTDHFQGTAPDLGAVERGCPLPIYGIRPPGTDESNEPTGCQ